MKKWLFLILIIFTIYPAITVSPSVMAGEYLSQITPVVSESQPKIPVYDIPLSEELQKYTWEQAQKYNLSYELILAIMFAESSFRIDADSGSSKGLFQLNRNTYPWIAQRLNIEKFNPFNARQNIQAGVWYLSYLRDYWYRQGLSDEEVLAPLLISYHRGIQGSYRYMKKYGLESNYVDKVFEIKTKLEREGTI